VLDGPAGLRPGVGKAEFFDAREASQDLTDGMRGEIFMVLRSQARNR
jgi:hypothetical protein